MTSREKSSRYYRRKRLLIYRPSSNDFLKTPPQPDAGARHDMSSPRGFLSSLHQASPMERERRRILSVELRDIAHEVEHLQVQTSPCERTSGNDDLSSCHRLTSTDVHQDLGFTQAPADLPVPTEDPSPTFPTDHPALIPPPLSPPKEETGWGLLPLFHSVRSKLESFAEIFLSPVKSHRVTHNPEPGERPGETNRECSVPADMSRDMIQPFTLSPGHHSGHPEQRRLSDLSSPVLHGDDTAEDNPSPSEPQRTPQHLKLQTETCQSPSALCRPPLQRHLSCPTLPLSQQKWRHSLDTLGYTTAEPCTCRRRRHSLGSVEECQNQSSMPFSMSCLRKENHPSVLKASLHPMGDVRRSPNGSIHTEGSPAGLCLDKDREQGLGGLEDQVTMESLPVSDFKTPENLCRSKENKVSTIQIRKRALRQEGKLTPLGLPKRVRLQKEDFSLEEIYTNKNYHTPTEKRKFETIFEEPIMKGGALILTSQRPLRRIMVFRDGGSAPRKRKKKGKPTGRTRRCPATSTQENVNYELLLQHKLNQLDAALQEDMADL